MNLNADLTQRALVHADRLPWVPSPVAGVERRMLFRQGGEQAVATSIVRYAPASSFPRHLHPGGEEFLVLEGVFEDEHARYPAGSYVRNPPGSAHSPRSTEGCVIFVRLRQFREDDRQHVADVPARDRDSLFEPRVLFQSSGEHVAIKSWEPHSAIEIAVRDGLELLVLDGELTVGGDTLERLSWLRLPPGASLIGVAGSTGCVAWIKNCTIDSEAARERERQLER
jgi:quercetin dioxygenase-like cupin family protein